MTASCPVTVAGSQAGLRINEAPSKVMWLKIIYRLVKDMLVIISNFWLLGFKNCGPIIKKMFQSKLEFANLSKDYHNDLFFLAKLQSLLN